MSADPLAEKSATELAGLLDGGKVSSVELVEAYLRRIERLNPSLNAYITVCAEEALEAARQSDAARAAGTTRGPLHGIPVAVKDQMHMRGLVTTAGGFLDAVAKNDSTVVARLRGASAILLGKLNLSEFAFGGNIQHPFGTARNPWNVERQPGHSSSGSGVAVAASLCAAAIGEDTGGSIRIPAAWCGVTGLRPTWGRVSRHGIQPVCWSMDQAGPMTKTAEDCALVYEGIAGHDPNDPYTLPDPVEHFRPQPDLGGLKVGIIRESLENPLTEPEVRAAVEKAGAAVSEVSLPLATDAGVISASIGDSDGAFVHRHWLRSRAEDYDEVTRRRLLAASLIPAQALPKGSTAACACASPGACGPGTGRCAALPHSANGCPKDRTHQRPKQQRGCSKEVRRATRCHDPLQSGRCPRYVGALRLQCRRPAHRLTASWTAPE